jgi:hypothetical protein
MTAGSAVAVTATAGDAARAVSVDVSVTGGGVPGSLGAVEDVRLSVGAVLCGRCRG